MHTCQQNIPTYPPVGSNIENGVWQYYTESGTWGPQSFLPQDWTSENCPDSSAAIVEMPMQCNALSPPLAYFLPVSVHQTSDTMLPKNDAENADLGETSDENDDGSEVSDYEESDHSQTRARSSTKSCDTPGVQRLGKWANDLDNIDILEARHYHCTYSDCQNKLCNSSFKRPEHLRRHVQTVHSGRRAFACKLPDCNTKFSRGDNLRDHYWTHLNRGGRLGKNKKYTFQELKVMLGPRDKKLIRRLKAKLIRTRAAS
ncbi:hypothetical protein ACN47E_006161 [Coniothyrium glycines]